MILDPGTYGYYSTGLVVAAAIVDVVTSRGFGWTAMATGWWSLDSLLQAAGQASAAGVLA